MMDGAFITACRSTNRLNSSSLIPRRLARRPTCTSADLHECPRETDVWVEARTGSRHQIGGDFCLFRQCEPAEEFLGTPTHPKAVRRQVVAPGCGRIITDGRRTRPDQHQIKFRSASIKISSRIEGDRRFQRYARVRCTEAGPLGRVGESVRNQARGVRNSRRDPFASFDNRRVPCQFGLAVQDGTDQGEAGRARA